MSIWDSSVSTDNFSSNWNSSDIGNSSWGNGNSNNNKKSSWDSIGDGWNSEPKLNDNGFNNNNNLSNANFRNDIKKSNNYQFKPYQTRDNKETSVYQNISMTEEFNEFSTEEVRFNDLFNGNIGNNNNNKSITNQTSVTNENVSSSGGWGDFNTNNDSNSIGGNNSSNNDAFNGWNTSKNNNTSNTDNFSDFWKSDNENNNKNERSQRTQPSNNFGSNLDSSNNSNDSWLNSSDSNNVFGGWNDSDNSSNSQNNQINQSGNNQNNQNKQNNQSQNQWGSWDQSTDSNKNNSDSINFGSSNSANEWTMSDNFDTKSNTQNQNKNQNLNSNSQSNLNQTQNLDFGTNGGMYARHNQNPYQINLSVSLEDIKYGTKPYESINSNSNNNNSNNINNYEIVSWNPNKRRKRPNLLKLKNTSNFEKNMNNYDKTSKFAKENNDQILKNWNINSSVNNNTNGIFTVSELQRLRKVKIEFKDLSKFKMINKQKFENGLREESESERDERDNRSVSPVSMDSENRQSQEFMDDCNENTPVSTKEDYYTIPSINELSLMTNEQLSKVDNFTIYHSKYGKVEFPGKSDLRGLNLDSIVTFKQNCIQIYDKNDNYKPTIGNGLNKYSIVTLFNVGSNTKSLNPKIFERKLKHLCNADSNVTFKFYNQQTFEWCFAVEHW